MSVAMMPWRLLVWTALLAVEEHDPEVFPKNVRNVRRRLNH